MTSGRDFAPLFAVRLNTSCTSDATELIYNPDTGDIEFVEPAGGKIIAVITIPTMRPQIGTPTRHLQIRAHGQSRRCGGHPRGALL